MNIFVGFLVILVGCQSLFEQQMQIFAGQLISHNNAANFLHAAAGHNWMPCWWYNGAKQSTLLHIWNQSEFYLPKTDAYMCVRWVTRGQKCKYLWIFGQKCKQILTNICEYLGEGRLNIVTTRPEQIRYLLLAETLMDLWWICGDFIWSSLGSRQFPFDQRPPPGSPVWVHVASEIGRNISRVTMDPGQCVSWKLN